MVTLGDISVTKKGGKGGNLHYCENCDYKCFDLNKWNRHILTSKHGKLTQGDISVTKKGGKGGIFHYCEFCDKSYGSRNGLWKHKKMCPNNKSNAIDNSNKNDKLLEYLIKENSELRKEQADVKELILEIVKNGTMNNSHNTNNNNSHNKAFNLNFFLNETCKNAMNITEFVDSIKLQLSDLISVGELGYVEGISNIIVKNLNALDETERPIHCTDKKRETVYIKDQDKWEKDDDEKKQLRKVIGKVAFKNQKLFPQFKEKYPDYNDAKSKHSDQYSKIVIESLDDSNKDKQDKIIKKITKEVLIDK